MRTTHEPVLRAFVEGRSSRRKTVPIYGSGAGKRLHTDGRILFSYDTPIAFRVEDGFWVADESYSATTNTQLAGLREMLHRVGYDGTKELAMYQWLEKHYDFVGETDRGWTGVEDEFQKFVALKPGEDLKYYRTRRLNPGTKELVLHSTATGLTYKWRGGHTINVYIDEKNVDAFSVGSYANERASLDAVRRGIKRYDKNVSEGNR